MVMLALAVLATWGIPTADEWLEGFSTYMDDGVMEQVAENRGRSLEGYKGGVALNRAGDLGRIVWLEWADGSIEGPYLSVDCAQRRHFGERERKRLIVEVDAQTARRRGFYGVGPVPVRAHFINPQVKRWTPI